MYFTNNTGCDKVFRNPLWQKVKKNLHLYFGGIKTEKVTGN